MTSSAPVRPFIIVIARITVGLPARILATSATMASRLVRYVCSGAS